MEKWGLVILLATGCFDQYGIVDQTDYKLPYQEAALDYVEKRFNEYFGAAVDPRGCELVWVSTRCEKQDGSLWPCVKHTNGETASGIYFSRGQVAFVAIPLPDYNVRHTAFAHELVHYWQDELGIPDLNHETDVWVWLTGFNVDLEREMGF